MFNLGDFSMKKTLVAMAALAAVSAFAQSSVTLYGRVDAGFFSQKTGVGAAAIRQTGIDNGSNVGLTGSRWGMRGTEDLGGGLKAGFKLENRFNIDNGGFSQTRVVTAAVAATATTPAIPAVTEPLLFGGEAFISLSGGFGQVRLGRMFTSFDDLRAIAVSKNNFDAAWSPVSDSYRVGLANYDGRGDNAIKYDTPNFGGISGGLMYAFGENKTALVSAGSQVSGHIKYANGPLAAGFGFQTEKATGAAVSTKHNAISVAYDLGVVALSGGYNNTKNGATKDNDYSIGVEMPLGAAKISAGFANSTSKAGAAAKLKGSGFGLSATYSMSKRTTLYTGYKSSNNKDGAGVKTRDITLFSLGVRHDF
ncbi:MAG: porin [Anaerolineae bacterium]|nr:porin [Anaerolineae bacterium]